MPAPHGTRSRYASKLHPCRCQPCRQANAEYNRRRRQRVGNYEVAPRDPWTIPEGWLAHARHDSPLLTLSNVA